MRLRLLAALAAGVSFVSLPVPAFGHHSFAAEFDSSKCTDIKGTLTKVDWENPHLYFYMDVQDSAGNVTPWTFEGHALGVLQRSGTHKIDFTENIGKTVSVRGCLAKSGLARAAAEWLTTPDGVRHFVGADVERADTPAGNISGGQDSTRAHNRSN